MAQYMATKYIASYSDPAIITAVAAALSQKYQYREITVEESHGWFWIKTDHFAYHNGAPQQLAQMKRFAWKQIWAFTHKEA